MEHSVKDKIFAIIQSIIVFDISDFDKETKEKVVKDVFHGLMDADYAEGKLLWRIACLKLNHRKIQIVWCFNHCIFDGMSAEILKKQIISKEKINLLDVETVKYEDYVNMLCKSAQNGNEKEILEAMHLKQWAKSNGSIVQKIKQDKPKTIFADAVSASENSILVGDLAKLLYQNGIEIGQKRLFQWLREKGYLIKQEGTSNNIPTQRSMEQGLFEIKETVITHSNSKPHISITTKVTGKGQVYFINKFLNRKEQ